MLQLGARQLNRIDIKRGTYLAYKYLSNVGRYITLIGSNLYFVLVNILPFQFYTSLMVEPVIAKEEVNVELEKSVEESTIVSSVLGNAITLDQKYKILGREHYTSNIEPYLEIIDKVLVEENLDKDSLFIQTMFYIGQHESHWNPNSVSSAFVGSEHPTGIFQFLPSTFRTVSKGNIYNPEDQIQAFIVMARNGRIDEFGTMYIHGYGPYLSKEAKAYMFSFSK